MTPPIVSVVICTHNPREDYLTRVLAALRGQTLPVESWELLVIDNGSKEPVSGRFDLSWHPHARHVRENQLGLTPARIRGIRESLGELIVFVDDDNVLDHEYLRHAFEIGRDHPFLGAWGGQAIGEFEIPPPTALTSYLPYLALKTFNTDVWCNFPEGGAVLPNGAGLCVRRAVAARYAQVAQEDPKRVALDRQGKGLGCCGDHDLIFTACDLGMGFGSFVRLRLTHLIAARRLTEKYLLGVLEGLGRSETILASFRPQGAAAKIPWWRGWLSVIAAWRLPRFDRAVRHALRKGRREGERVVRGATT